MITEIAAGEHILHTDFPRPFQSSLAISRYVYLLHLSTRSQRGLGQLLIMANQLWHRKVRTLSLLIIHLFNVRAAIPGAPSRNSF